MNKLIGTLALGAAIAFATPVFADDTDAPALSTSGTMIGQLLEDDGAKAVLEEHIPEVVNNPQIGMAYGMTLKDVQMYAPDQLSDDVLAEIDEDLAGL